MTTLVWEATECPSCGATVSVGLMSLAATCACGIVYVAAGRDPGWYYSWPHYASGEEPVGEKVRGESDALPEA